MIADGTASLPVRIVFLAHTSGLGPQAPDTCYSGGEALPKPCSTEEGVPPFARADECRLMSTEACTTAREFVIVGSTERHESSDAPAWFELTEIKLFDEAGNNVAPNADEVQILYPSSGAPFAKQNSCITRCHLHDNDRF